MKYDDIKLGLFDKLRVWLGQSADELLQRKKIQVATKDAKKEYKECVVASARTKEAEEEYIKQYLIAEGVIIPVLPEGEVRDSYENEQRKEFLEKNKFYMPEKDLSNISENNQEFDVTRTFQTLLDAEKENLAKLEEEHKSKYTNTTYVPLGIKELEQSDPRAHGLLEAIIGYNDIATYKELEGALETLNSSYKLYQDSNPEFYDPTSPKYFDEEHKTIVETFDKSIAHIQNLVGPKIESEAKLSQEKSKVYSLERYIELLPYTSVTVNEDFKEYMNRRYANENDDINMGMQGLKENKPEIYEILVGVTGDIDTMKCGEIRVATEWVKHASALHRSSVGNFYLPESMEYEILSEEQRRQNDILRGEHENRSATYERAIQYLEGLAGLEIKNGEVLSQEEKAIYTYVSEKEGRYKGEEYLGKMQDMINNRKGKMQADSYINKIVKSNKGVLDIAGDVWTTTTTGAGDGIVTFGEGIANVFANDGIMSENQYKQMHINYMLTRDYDIARVNSLRDMLLNGDERLKAEASEELNRYGLLNRDGTLNENGYNQYGKMSELNELYRKGLGVNYEVAVNVGNMAVPMVAGTAATIISGGASTPIAGLTVGEATSLGLMGVSATGNAVEEAHQARSNWS